MKKLKEISEKLFSVKKRFIQNENYRVVTVLGITFKIPLKNRIKPVSAKNVCRNAMLMYPEEKFVFTEQRDALGNLDEDFKEYSYTIPETYLYQFDNAYVFNNEAVIFPNEKTVVEEINRFDKNLYIGKRYLDVSSIEYYDGTVAVLTFNDLDKNYYHWCIDCLPNLYLLMKSKIFIDYYIIDNTLSFQKEYLALLGIPEEKIIKTSPQKMIQAKKLICSSVYRVNWKWVNYRGYGYTSRLSVPHWTFNIFKEYFREIQGNNTERIYISRRNARCRKIENEEEIIAVCKKYDFTVLELEKLSVLEQIQTVRDAKIVVSIHGAGLANIVHSSKQVRVLELKTEYYNHIAFKLMSQVLGHEYYFLTGKTKDLNIEPQFENVYIDPKVFESVLTDIINNG